MTKEEAIRIVATDTNPEYFGNFPEMARYTVECFIREIYNDFESRTCSSCKHIRESIVTEYEYICNVGVGHIQVYDHLYIDKDFGCNRYEPRV